MDTLKLPAAIHLEFMKIFLYICIIYIDISVSFYVNMKYLSLIDTAMNSIKM